MIRKILVLVLLLAVLPACSRHAAHPLILLTEFGILLPNDVFEIDQAQYDIRSQTVFFQFLQGL